MAAATCDDTDAAVGGPLPAFPGPALEFGKPGWSPQPFPGWDFIPPPLPTRGPPTLNWPPWTALNADLLEEWAGGHPNQQLLLHCVDGIRNGFDDTADFPDLPPRVIPDSRTGLALPEILEAEALAEAAAGRYWPSCKTQDIGRHPGARTWPLGLAKKKTHSGPQRCRPTLNLSKSVGKEPSLNECMPKAFLTVNASHLCAVRKPLHFGPGCAFNKCDQVKAYRHCGRLPAYLLRRLIEWKGQVWVDRSISFGSSSAPAQCTAIMSLVAFIVNKRLAEEFGSENVIVAFLLDDLATVLRDIDMARRAHPVMLGIYKALGFVINVETSDKALTLGEWLGLTFDIPALMIRLPDDEWKSCRADVVRAMEESKSSGKQLGVMGGGLTTPVMCGLRCAHVCMRCGDSRQRWGASQHEPTRERPGWSKTWPASSGSLTAPQLDRLSNVRSQTSPCERPTDPGADGLAIIGDASGTDGFGFAVSVQFSCQCVRMLGALPMDLAAPLRPR